MVNNKIFMVWIECTETDMIQCEMDPFLAENNIDSPNKALYQYCVNPSIPWVKVLLIKIKHKMDITKKFKSNDCSFLLLLEGYVRT